MKPIFNEKLNSLILTSNRDILRTIYHYPNEGYLGGWAFSLIYTNIVGCVEGLKLIENIAFLAFNLISCPFSEKAKKDIKVTLINLKSCKKIIELPATFTSFRVVYTQQPTQDAKRISDYGWEVLHFAAAYEDRKLLEQLVQDKTDLNKTAGLYNTTALHFAVMYKSVKSIEILLRAKADSTILNAFKQSPLDLAVIFGYLPTIEALINGGADVNKANEYGFSALHFAVISKEGLEFICEKHPLKESYKKVIKMLIEKGAQVDRADNRERTPLMQAVIEGQIESIHALIKHNADVNLKDDLGRTALHLAIHLNNGKAFQALMQYSQKIDFNVQNDKGETALHLATTQKAERAKFYIQELLKNTSLQPDLQDKEGSTALHWAYQERVVSKEDDKNEILSLLKFSMNETLCDRNNKRAEEYQSASEIYTNQITVESKVCERKQTEDIMDYYVYFGRKT